MELKDIFNDELETIEPFKAKELLKRYAEKENKEIIDMSRGDPSYPPSLEVQKALACLTALTLKIQELVGEDKSVLWHLGSFQILKALEELKKWYNKEYFNITQELINKLAIITGKPANDLWVDLVRGLQSTGYGDVAGESEVRDTIKYYLEKHFNILVPSQNIILTLGAAEAIGKLFDMFRDEFKLDYLKPHDYIGTLSPVYGPYNDIVLSSRLACESIPLDVDTNGDFEPSEEHFKSFEEKIKEKKLKVFILVHPNNPTGRIFSEKTLKKLSDILSQQKECIVIEDIVYADFAKDKFTSISKFLPEKTIIIGSLSKYYRATGNRLGYVAFTKACAEFLTEKKFPSTLESLQKEIYKIDIDGIVGLFRIAKSPDPSGALCHTHLCPKVAQYLGMLKLILDDGKKFATEMQKKWNYFYREIGMPEMVQNAEKFVPYYCLVDFKKLIRKRNEDFPYLLNAIENKRIKPGQFLTFLAKKSIVVMPAGGFFIVEKKPEDVKTENENYWLVRFSVANIEFSHLEKALKIINETLAELEKYFSQKNPPSHCGNGKG